jgi:hypothetical protein
VGFWSGFYQGYTDEKNRQEEKRQYQEALDLKKKEMVMQIAQRRAELGMTSGTGTGGGSANAYAASLARMGVDADRVARLASEGGTTALKETYDALQSGFDETNPYTPEQLNTFVDGVVIASSEGGTVDVNEIARTAGVTLDPLEQEFASVMTAQPSATTVLMPLPGAKGPSIEQINQAINLANGRIGDTLDEAIASNNAAMAAATDDETKRILAEKNTELLSAKTSLDQGVIGPAQRLVGGNIMSQIVASQPSLAESPVIQNYGVVVQEVPAAGLRFNTEAEAQAAIEAGQVPPDAIFWVGNKQYTNN